MRIDLGPVSIERIADVERLYFPPQSLLPGCTPALLAANADWLGPDFVDAEGRLILSMHALLLRTPDKVILVDSGIGPKRLPPTTASGAGPRLPENLARAGITPAQIDIVLCTHLHSDRVGWNMREDCPTAPMFPRARYWFGRAEFAHIRATYGARPEHPVGAALADSVLPILAAGQAELFDMAAIVAAGADWRIRLQPAVGHSAGHVMVHVETPLGHAILAGDVMHHPIQLAEPGLAVGGEFDPAAAAAFRRTCCAQWADTDALVLGAHFPPPLAGKIREAGGRRVFHWMPAADRGRQGA